MKGGSSPHLDKLLDKDELKVDLDSFSHGKCAYFSIHLNSKPVPNGFLLGSYWVPICATLIAPYANLRLTAGDYQIFLVSRK